MELFDMILNSLINFKITISTCVLLYKIVASTTASKIRGNMKIDVRK